MQTFSFSVLVAPADLNELFIVVVVVVVIVIITLPLLACKNSRPSVLVATSGLK